MKTTGIVLLVFAALNFIVAIIAVGSGAEDAAGRKISSAVLLAVIGGVLFYFGKQKEEKKQEERIAKQEREEEERRQTLLAEQKRRETIRRQQQMELKKKEEAEKQKVFEANSKKFKILNFYLDTPYWHDQEREIKKCPLSLPVEIVDVDKDEETVQKYNVNNLPKLILVDYNGKEIKRWKGVTETSEINDYLYENGYADKEAVEFTNAEDDDIFDDDNNGDYPKPMFTLTPEDMKILMSDEYMTKGISIAADGGTKEQTQVKFEILLGKREKTEDMLAVEKPIREFFRRIYGEAAKIAYESTDNALLRRLSVATAMMKMYDEINKEGGTFYESKEKMIKIANKYGVSVNIIEEEEKQKIQDKYNKF